MMKEKKREIQIFQDFQVNLDDDITKDWNFEEANILNNQEFKISVTETEVIWSWDDFSTVWRNYDRKSREWIVNKTIEEPEKRYMVNTREKAFYPILVYTDCSTVGDSNSFEILHSKVGA